MNDGAALQGFQLHERRDGERRARQHRQCRPGRGVDGGQKRRGRRRRTVPAQCGRREPAALFSLRLLQAHDNAERFLLAVHGNTGFDASAAWDAQPGRFTERLAHGYCSRTTGKPIWLRTPGKYSITSTGWWILPPVAEQIVLVCPTFVMTAMRVVYTFSRRGQYAVFGLGASDVRSGGRLRCRDGTQHGAVVGVEREQRDGAHAFRAVRGPAGRQQRVLFLQQQLRQRGAALGRGPMPRNSRPRGPTATGRARLRPAWSAPASPCAMSSGG